MSELVRAEKQLNLLVDKYQKYNSKDELIGGIYYGRAAMATFRDGKLSVIKSLQQFGLKIGAGWFPMPSTANTAEARDKFYAERRALVDEIKREADPTLIALIESWQEAGIPMIKRPVWEYGSSWSSYCVRTNVSSYDKATLQRLREIINE